MKLFYETPLSEEERAELGLPLSAEEVGGLEQLGKLLGIDPPKSVEEALDRVVQEFRRDDEAHARHEMEMARRCQGGRACRHYPKVRICGHLVSDSKQKRTIEKNTQTIALARGVRRDGTRTGSRFHVG